MNESGLLALQDIQQRLLQAYRAEVARLRQQLEVLESGVMRIGERRPKGRWNDITERQINYLRTGIAEYERTIDDLVREVGDASPKKP